jgi:uncharacterized membrane protein HdeD (DUF308 family)
LFPKPTLGAFVLAFAAYVAADGAMALVTGIRAMRRGELWQTLIFEGAVNLTVTGVVLVWPALASCACWHDICCLGGAGGLSDRPP